VRYTLHVKDRQFYYNPGNILRQESDPLVAKYVITPVVAPLFFAGFVLFLCVVSLVRRESVYPAGPPWGLHEPIATAGLGLLCLVVSLPYFICAFRIDRSTRFLGYSRQFWRTLVTSTFGAGVFLALVLTALILVVFAK
jgi:hypothetical protein